MRSILFFLVLLYSLLVMAFKMQGAEITFVEQPQAVGSLKQYEVGACNWTTQTEQVWGITVWQQAQRIGIMPASMASVLAEQASLERISWQRITLLVLEGASAAGTIAVTSGALDLSIDTPRGKVLASLIPATGLAIRTATTLIKRETPKLEIPMDRLLPGSFTLVPGGCMTFVMYGRPGPGVPVPVSVPSTPPALKPTTQ